MKILNRYLFKEIFYHLAIVLGILLTLLTIHTLHDIRGDVLENQAAWQDVVLYLLLTLPARFSITLPLACWLATCFAYGLMAKSRELVAMVAAGLSFRRLALPALAFGVGMTAFAFVFNEHLVPAMERRADYVINIKIKQKREDVFTSTEKLFVKGTGRRFYYMENYHADRRMMEYPSIVNVGEANTGLSERIEAREGHIRGGPNQPRIAGLSAEDLAGSAQMVLELIGAERWTFAPDGSLVAYEAFPLPWRIPLDEPLDQFLISRIKPDQMGFAELNAYRGVLALKGGENLSRISTDLQRKLAFPVACLLMTMLGYVTAADILARRFTRGFVLGLTIAAGYYLLDAFLGDFGNSGALDPVIAAWFPLAVFAGVVVFLLVRLNKVRG